jgi:hypothetical protein
VGISVVSAGAGIAGGILVGRNAFAKKRTALGIPLPNAKIDFGGLAQHVGEAGRQFGRLAQEIRTVREKAEQVARTIS